MVHPVPMDSNGLSMDYQWIIIIIMFPIQMAIYGYHL